MFRSTARSIGTWWAMFAALVVGLALLVMLTSPGSHPQPAQAQTKGTTTAPRVVFSSNAAIVAEFSKMVGAVSPIEYIEETTDGGAIVKRAEPKSPSIVLERLAGARGTELSDWHKAARVGASGHKTSGTLIFIDGSGQRTLHLQLENAWPSEYRVEQRGTQIVEIVTLRAASLERVAPS